MPCLVIFHNLFKVKQKNQKNFDTAEGSRDSFTVVFSEWASFKMRTSVSSKCRLLTMKAFLPALFIWVPSVNWHYLRILTKSTDFIWDYVFLSRLLCSHEICLQPFGDKAHQWTNLVFLSRSRIICICLVSEKNKNRVEEMCLVLWDSSRFFYLTSCWNPTGQEEQASSKSCAL